MNISKNIATTITQYLKETINRDKEREVLLVDEHGKEIVYDNGDYRIVVDDKDNARYITLWHKKYVKGNGKWTKCGVLDANRTTVNNDDMKGDYLSIGSVEINKNIEAKDLVLKCTKPYLISLAMILRVFSLTFPIEVIRNKFLEYIQN
jgi:hypothetical protein